MAKKHDIIEETLEKEELNYRRRPKIKTCVRIDSPKIKKMMRVERRGFAEILDWAIDELYESRMDPDIRMSNLLDYATDAIYYLDMQAELESLDRRQLELRLAFQQIKDICEKHVKDN